MATVDVKSPNDQQIGCEIDLILSAYVNICDKQTVPLQLQIVDLLIKE